MGQDHDIDQSLLELDRALHELAQLGVDQAAKERGWAALSHELDQHPLGKAAPAHGRAALPGLALWARRGRDGSAARRWAFGSLGAAVVVVALVLGLYGAGAWTGGDQGQDPGPVASVVNSGDGTGETGKTTVPTQPGSSGPGTMTPGTSPDTTGGATASAGAVTPGGEVTPSTTPSSSSSTLSTSGGTSSGMGATATTERPTTTARTAVTPTTAVTSPLPESTTTVSPPQFASAQRDKTAQAAALDLGALVMEYFNTGDMSGARALVAPEAQSSLVQMISSLTAPYAFRWLSTEVVSEDTARVVLEFNDRVTNGQGEQVETTKRYALIIRVSNESAVVTRITAAP